MKDSIIRLRALEKQLYAYLYALTVIDFDAETIAPEGSADGRAEATEVLSRANFDLLVNEKTAALLKKAAADAETEQEKAEVRNLQRQYDEIAKIPADEYAAFTKLCSQSVPAWVKAKRTNDFSIFAPYLEKIVAARRAQAHYFAHPGPGQRRPHRLPRPGMAHRRPAQGQREDHAAVGAGPRPQPPVRERAPLHHRVLAR